MFHNVSLKIAYLLCALVSASNLACGSIESLLQKPTSRVELKDWSIVTDQEAISHLVYRKRGIFALAEESFVVVYPKDKMITPFVDSNRLPQNDYSTFWVEQLDAEQKVFFEKKMTQNSINNVQIESESIPKIPNQPVERATSKPSQDPVKMDIEIEVENDSHEEVLDLEIEELSLTDSKRVDTEVKLKATHKYIMYAGSPNGLYAKSYIFTDRWILINPQQDWVKISNQAISHLITRKQGGAWWGGREGVGIVKQAQISRTLGTERVKFLSESSEGLYVVSASDELFIYKESKISSSIDTQSNTGSGSKEKLSILKNKEDLPKNQHVEKTLVSQQASKSKSVKRQAEKQAQNMLSQPSNTEFDQAQKIEKNILNPRFDLAVDIKRERVLEACQGPILAMSSQVNNGQMIFFCGSGQDSLVMKDEQGWHRFNHGVNMPQKSKVMTFEKGWIYRSRGLWYYLSSSPRNLRADESNSGTSPKGTTRTEGLDKKVNQGKQGHELVSVNSQQKLWLTSVNLVKHNQDLVHTGIKSKSVSNSRKFSTMSTWISVRTDPQSEVNTLLIARPYQGIEQWSDLLARPQKVVIKTYTLSAKVIQKAFISDQKGRLMTTTSFGTLIGTKNHWELIKPKQDNGQILGLAQCQNLLLITSKVAKRSSDSNESSSTQRLLEIWPLNAQQALFSFDWSNQQFRDGEPSLGEVKCDTKGTIYANLFWGRSARRLSVGLLVIDPNSKKVTIWERRQGYDGEVHLSTTPLLPSSTFNAMSFAQDQSLYIATNSGLLKVRYHAKTKAEQLQVFDEAQGLSVESFSDIQHEVEGMGTEHLWLASPYGLLRMINNELRIKLKGVVTALAYDTQGKNFWVSFKQQLWIGQGQGQERKWRRVRLPQDLELGQINHIYPTAEGALWLLSDRGIFFNENISKQLQ